MLALMAARAGAASVTTCEKDPLIANLAREIAARNGYADRIHVVTGSSRDVMLGEGLAQRADLLFCDIFGDNLFNFDPFAAIADAKARLLVPGARIVPETVSLHVALAHWAQYDYAAHIDSAAGFDLGPLADFAPVGHHLKMGDPGVRLLSQPREIYRAVLAEPFSHTGEATVVCTATEACEANGVARWIRLELDGDTILESRPEPGATSFSNPMFVSFPKPLTLRAGEELPIASSFAASKIETWAAQR
jgi:type II protein arginine methyltransferase